MSERDKKILLITIPIAVGMLIYILMALILAFRPQGLFPPKGR